uniref:Uncharacterized protein n=1 Tax=Physcomitrium patens TaxID=3218 RepID=A0A2K1JUU4_PHYPA|nr:hypothetical protein PHYPA_015069 [Physcomitrium patens]
MWFLTQIPRNNKHHLRTYLPYHLIFTYFCFFVFLFFVSFSSVFFFLNNDILSSYVKFSTASKIYVWIIIQDNKWVDSVVLKSYYR